MVLQSFIRVFKPKSYRGKKQEFGGVFRPAELKPYIFGISMIFYAKKNTVVGIRYNKLEWSPNPINHALRVQW